MQALLDPTRVRRLLCIGAHSDDLEIGCGATVLRLLRQSPGCVVTWAVFCAGGGRGGEARAAAEEMLRQAGEARVVLFEFRDAHLPASWGEVKAAMGELRSSEPDLILTHRHDDAHQDHRLLGELTMQAFRDHATLGYEIPKYDGDLGRPTLYAPASAADFAAKLAALGHFASQRDKHWFDDATFRGLARLRGLECAAASGLAEAFYPRKMCI